MVSLYLSLLSISMKVMNKVSLWSGKDLGKLVLGTYRSGTSPPGQLPSPPLLE